MIRLALTACDRYLAHVHRATASAGEAILCWTMLWIGARL